MLSCLNCALVDLKGFSLGPHGVSSIMLLLEMLKPSGIKDPSLPLTGLEAEEGTVQDAAHLLLSMG